MVIKFPWPDSALLPNRRLGRAWTSTNTAKVKAKEAAYYATKQAMGAWKAPDGYIPISIVFNPPDKRHRDLDNCLASCKAMLDGMAQALQADDSRFRPVMLDWGVFGKPGSVIVAVGVKIISMEET